MEPTDPVDSTPEQEPDEATLKRRQYARDYYQRNKERIRDYKRRWYQENKERRKQADKDHYAANREARVKRMRQRHVERLMGIPAREGLKLTEEERAELWCKHTANNIRQGKPADAPIDDPTKPRPKTIKRVIGADEITQRIERERKRKH